jgi:integrase
MRLESPTEDEDVAIALRRAFRKKRRRPKQALGITAERLERLLKSCGEDLKGARDRAMLKVGYDTLCRRAELVALRVEDIQEDGNGGARILIRRSKNDPFGDGRYGRLSQAALEALKYWLQQSKIKSGFIFKSINNGKVTRDGLHPYAVNRMVKQLATTAEFDAAMIADLSGHSFRVGAAQDLMTSGKSVLAIMKAGGWRSMSVVGRYVENAEF